MRVVTRTAEIRLFHGKTPAYQAYKPPQHRSAMGIKTLSGQRSRVGYQWSFQATDSTSTRCLGDWIAAVTGEEGRLWHLVFVPLPPS